MDFLAIVFGIVFGTVIFLWINKIFDISYFGFKGIAGTWLGCFFAAIAILTVIVKILGGVFGFIGSLIVILIKLVLFGLMIYGIYQGYKKMTSKNDDTSIEE